MLKRNKGVQDFGPNMRGEQSRPEHKNVEFIREIFFEGDEEEEEEVHINLQHHLRLTTRTFRCETSQFSH